ncbi:hypothetical protein [Tenacibaculum finnmarkense]|uniref:hypothetical protein n=1 Tax=Tenacibaculum finnmarkense TaxID=2781243 RepID=UPI002079CB75|nr:hypothetical protein [Tenacibaculum finnmarkense]MCM8906789.1 hypothetical protein [Tenacibaculum finnmarkense genomovar finnmarkense]
MKKSAENNQTAKNYNLSIDSKIINYEILKSFCGNDELRPLLNSPFKIDNKAYSTNGFILASIDLDDIYTDDEVAVSKKNLSSLTGFKENQLLALSVSALKNLFASAPTQLCYEVSSKDTECSECMGLGEVEWTYQGHEQTFDCPVCDGIGQLSIKNSSIIFGKTEIKEDLTVIIGNSKFFVKNLQRLIVVAEKLNESCIVMVYQNQSNKGSLFRIKYFDILVYPCSVEDDSLNIATY